jgi:hypothetical protein
MRITRSLLAVLFVLIGAASASAQAVKIEFKDGFVTLSAQNAPIRTILNEWNRQGGTRILNGERITGAPVTLEFNNAPERQVLDTILRSVSGYVLAPRREGSTARSSFDSIMIVPTGTPAPRPAGTPNQPTTFRPPPQVPQPPPVAFDPDDPEENPPGDIGPDDPQEDLPARGPRRVRVPGGRQPDPDDDEPEVEDAEPAPRPNNPFGVQPGSNQPGSITPVPRRNRPQDEPE